MAAVIARVTGTALAPGISRNGRLYTRDAIAKAVARAQERIADGTRPISMRSHHAADDDSTRIVARVTKMWQDPQTGKARYNADIADTAHGRTIAALTDDSDGHPAFLRGVSIRGQWMEEPRTETVDGREVWTADDLEIHGLDYTAEPGVDAADVSHAAYRDGDERAADDRFALTESVSDTLVEAPAVEEKGAPALKSGKAATAQTKAKTYADPGYQDDKMKRYALDTKSEAKAAWSYIHQADNAKNYTANQLKRIKQRIVKALKAFGVKVAADGESVYLIDPVAALTESVTLAECMGWDGPGETGRYYISMTNGPTTVTISSDVIDPADLDLVGRAAMDGACKALAAIDPDMDGDIDVPGASAEDSDDDAPVSEVPGMPCPCGCGCAIPHPSTGTTCPCGCGCEICGSEQPETDADESAPTLEPAVPEETLTQTPAPDPAAETTTTREEPAVSEPTIPAVESTAAAPAPAPAVTLSAEQFQQLLAAASRPVETATPAATADTAPVATTAAQPAPAPAPVAEKSIAQMVQEGITAGIQAMVASGAVNPGRKGLVRPVNGEAQQGMTDLGIPESWPQKPLHEYTTEERRKYIDVAWGEHFFGDELYAQQMRRRP